MYGQRYDFFKGPIIKYRWGEGFRLQNGKIAGPKMFVNPP